ncbi:hypothetical protein E8E12_003514 [Didymella heteroderae]|uniref:NAD-dependent epimerase/dehydratase domain-containing protein n=1 Tax=Didymella heteroderae TaxID=1769908 RepID=A0A9P4WI08_9PLEO|nr:hypothetical protein E8E12_003514 [Didymella heteroderae]
MSQPLIFITGATGFIGAHVVTQALSAGYHVRLSVRKEAQISTLRKLFSSHSANLDFVVVPDLTSPDAFNEALHGVTYVFHLASPLPGKGDDFENDYVKPAVSGTIALLDAANGVETIKRVVIVSSLLALIPLDALVTGKFTAKEGQIITIDPSMSFPTDPRAAGGLKYHASKILAHRATHDWAASSAPRYSIVTLHPSFVFGANLLQSSPDALDGTNAMLWSSLTSPQPVIPMSAVDVRDVAAAHIRALEVDVRDGEVEEFIVCAGEKEGWTWDRVADFVKRKYAFVAVKLEGPFEQPPSADTSKAERVLGFGWRSMEDTVGSFLDHQVELRGKL